MELFSAKSNNKIKENLENRTLSFLRARIKRHAYMVFGLNAGLFSFSAFLGIVTGSRFYTEASESGLFAYLSLFLDNRAEAFAYMSDLAPIITNSIHASLFAGLCISVVSLFIFSYRTAKSGRMVMGMRVG